METQYIKTYSSELQRDMECKLYGHSGRPVLFIPCQDGRYFDFENFNMTDTWSPWIESGEVMVLAIDTIDKETWSDLFAPAYDRIRRHEAWMRYIVYEAVPMLQAIAREKNGWEGDSGVIVFGCSLGATHAANLFLRFPDKFCGTLALSGIYTSEYGFGDYMDETLYMNSPALYLQNMQPSHPYVERYNNNFGIICTGQGAWEEPGTLRHLEENFKRLGADIWCDFWGYDVNHDWPWWYKQVQYFVPKLLGLE